MSKIREYAKQYVQDFIGNGLYDLLKYLLSLFFVSMLGTGTIYEITELFLKNKCIKLFISICSLFLFIIIFVNVYKHIKKYKFKIIEMKINFEYKQDKIIVISEVKIKALRKGIDRIYNRTTWFPDESTRISCLEKEFTIEQLPKRDTSNEYYVKLNRTLKKGEIITFTTKVVNSNNKSHFKDFYSREIITPIDKLIMIVVIPAEYGYKYITKETIKGSAYNDFLSKEKLEFLNTYTWKIEKPRLGYEYKLFWEKK